MSQDLQHGLPRFFPLLFRRREKRADSTRGDKWGQDAFATWRRAPDCPVLLANLTLQFPCAASGERNSAISRRTAPVAHGWADMIHNRLIYLPLAAACIAAAASQVWAQPAASPPQMLSDAELTSVCFVNADLGWA